MFKSKGGRLLVNLSGILVVLIAIGLTLYFLFNKLTEKSFYEEYGTVKLEGLKSQVEIVRDSYGVPNITSANEEDLYFALGYTHAQDRLWQMDFVRRVAEGRTAEIFGRETVEFDKLFRTIGINRYSYSLYPGISAKSKSILENYSNGVNAFIRKNNKKLPLEFDILNYKPEEWKPEHSLMVVRMMGWELNLSWLTEFTFGEILKRFGVEKSKDFFPDYPEDAPYTVKQEKDNTVTKKEITSSEIKAIENRYRSITELGSGFFETVTGYREFYNMTGTHIGSNAWAVNGNKTEGKKPILANDPHLALLVPARWYEVVMHNTSDNSMVCGFSIPGAPGIAIGSNGKISWGMTNLMNDDSDFLILNRDSANYNRYIYKNVSHPIDSLEEYIKIKDVKDELPYYVCTTMLGPVISSLNKTGFTGDSKFNLPKNEIMTFKWTGFEASDEILAFYDVYHSNNWNEFRTSLKNFGLPASNFVYADAGGNIGYQAAGKIPVRKVTGEINQAVPQYGDIEWTGFVPFDELPVSYNPPDNIVASANNKPQKDYKYYISNLYEEPYRAMRIEEVLKSKNNITAQEFKLLQNDVVSIQAKEWFRYVVDSFRDSSSMNPLEKKVITAIKRWDYDMNRLSWLGVLFAEFEVQLYKDLYKGRLGDELFYNYLYLNNVPIRNTSKLLRENSSWILGSANDSDKTNNRNKLVRHTFRLALKNCIRRFNTEDFEKWHWGDIHRITMRHPLGSVPALSKILNIGDFKLGGLGTTVSNAEYSFRQAIEKQEFDCFIGASMRFIYDFNEPEFYYSILPTGQSGQPEHKNYSDQIKSWANAEYKKVYLNPADLKKSGNEVKILVLIPR